MIGSTATSGIHATSASIVPASTSPEATHRPSGDDLIARLLQQVEGRHEMAYSRIQSRIGNLQGRTVSTAEMLRLQAEMGGFMMRVQLTVRIAEDIGRALQTLSQRS